MEIEKTPHARFAIVSGRRIGAALVLKLDLSCIEMFIRKLLFPSPPPPSKRSLGRSARKRNPIKYYLLYILSRFIPSQVKRKEFCRKYGRGFNPSVATPEYASAVTRFDVYVVPLKDSRIPRIRSLVKLASAIDEQGERVINDIKRLS